eukprot:14442226-Alexandrium_andersonii.AAC.1
MARIQSIRHPIACVTGFDYVRQCALAMLLWGGCVASSWGCRKLCRSDVTLPGCRASHLRQ